MRKVFYLIIAVNFCSSLYAQNEGTLFFMNSLPQVSYVNPAFFPKYKTSLGLPGSSVMVFYSNNGFSYNDLVTVNNGVTTADLNKLYSSLKPENYITQALQADLLRVSTKIGARFYLTANVTAKEYNRLMLPKDFVGLLVNGTTPFLGRNVSFSPKMESIGFIETAVGGAYRVDKDLVVGARVKWLKGVANGTTESSQLNVSIDQNTYAMTVQGGMDVRTSGIQNFSQSGFDFGKSYNDYLTNNGFSFDVGGAYRFMDRVNVSLSLIDIGSINWKNNTYGYTLDPATAKYTFKGVDLNKAFNGGDAANGAGDSLQNRFKPKDQAIASYSTPIPGKIYLGGNYEIRRNLTAGLVMYSEMYRGRFLTGVTLGVNKNFGKRFSASGTYTISNSSYNNIGLGASLNVPPFQLYVVGDNLLRAPFSGDLNKFVNSTQVFNLRMGLNFVFGWDKGPDKLPSNAPSPAYKSKKRKAKLSP